MDPAIILISVPTIVLMNVLMIALAIAVFIVRSTRIIELLPQQLFNELALVTSSQKERSKTIS
jgi:hypothetical protein